VNIDATRNKGARIGTIVISLAGVGDAQWQVPGVQQPLVVEC
jgi:hypothetical protein